MSRDNTRIANLTVHVDRDGTFQEFNDVVAPLTRLTYVDNTYKGYVVNIPSTGSQDLFGLELSLREILSRVPGIEELYRMTFSEHPNNEPLSIELSIQAANEFRLRIDDKELFHDRESLKEIVSRLRNKFPFLSDWRLTSAQRAWGHSVIYFRNMENKEIDEFSEPYLSSVNESFEERPIPNDQNKLFPLAERMHPLAGGFSSSQTAISPVGGFHLSEFSLHYLGLYLLSSLVRYRPEIWTHAISRSSFENVEADDKALSLIERFLVLNSQIVPDMVTTILNPHEDAWFN